MHYQSQVPKLIPHIIQQVRRPRSFGLYLPEELLVPTSVMRALRHHLPRKVAALSCSSSIVRCVHPHVLASRQCRNYVSTHIGASLGLTTRAFSGGTGQKVVPVPSMGDSITEGSLNHWKKNVGEAVAADEVVAVVDTDKVSVDINTPVGGVITELKAKEGDTIFVGDSLFVVDTDAVAAASTKKEPETLPSAPSPSPQPSAAAAPPRPPTTIPPPPRGTSTSPPHPSATLQERGERRAPMSRMRLRIAERLKGAQNTAAMLTTFTECDMGSLMAMRSEMNEGFQEAHGVKMGFVSAFLLASAKSLKKMPDVNAYIEDKDIVFKDYADISVAVATPNGLMVPVIRDCDKKTWADLERDLADLAARARNGQIALEDMAGGSFTVSNGGVYGSMLGTPLINPPQSSILGMHGVTKRAVVRGNEIVIRPMMYLALTYDHRLIDGREAVQFLSSIRDYIEDPRKMLLDM
eukprot:GHVS01088937.1.p1 GENE.GHVS01088937.1~~GHVS01088937.1.p1  ORF type:complete len:465 (+),score=49.50 GHVS01088937.1:17-1411(+)